MINEGQEIEINYTIWYLSALENDGRGFQFHSEESLKFFDANSRCMAILLSFKYLLDIDNIDAGIWELPKRDHSKKKWPDDLGIFIGQQF